jgi:hypothetical protein
LHGQVKGQKKVQCFKWPRTVVQLCELSTFKMAGRLLTLVALPLVALLPFVEGFQLVPARPLFQRIAAVVPPRSALALVCMGMPGSKITGRGEPSLGGGASLPRPIPLPPLSLPSRFRYFCRNPFMDPVLLARALHRPNPDCPRKNGTGMDQYDIAVDGARCKNGKLGKVIYDKILADQKRMYTQRPMAGFRAGLLVNSPQVLDDGRLRMQQKVPNNTIAPV